MYPVSSKTYTHGNKSLFNWYVWFLYMISFSIPRTFTLRSISPAQVILREAKGEVAESIIEQITLVIPKRWDRCRRWLRAGEEHFPLNS